MPKATSPAPLSEQWLKDRMDEKTWYQIDAKAAAGKKADTAKVYIFDEISMWGVSAQQFVRDVAALDVSTIELHLNSPGGSFFEGVAIMNTLKDHKASVSVRVDGLAASAASVIAMGGDEVVMAAGSQMMIHEASIIALGKVDDLNKAVKQLSAINATMANLYQDKAGGTVEEWAAAMAEETWYLAQEAVDAGLADRLDAAVPEDTTVAAMARFDLSVFAHAGRADAPAPYSPAEPDGSKTPEKEGGKEMPLNKKLVESATRLGVKDPDKLADNDALIDAIDTATEARTKAEADAKAAAEKAEKDAKEADAPTGEGSTKVPKGMVLVDSETIESLQASAKRSDQVVKDAQAEKRDNAVDLAVRDGKIPVSRAPHWKALWDNDPEGTKSALAGIPKGLVPTSQIGDSSMDSDEFPEYAELYPEGV
jgi:ATP-dependent protease ClpP protease subunit